MAPNFENHYSCRYKSTSNAEQHFFPSSLAFNFMCLLDFGLIHAAHLGFQRKVLLELRSQGKDDLVEPNALYSVCLLAGNYFLDLIIFFKFLYFNFLIIFLNFAKRSCGRWRFAKFGEITWTGSGSNFAAKMFNPYGGSWSQFGGLFKELLITLEWR